MNSNTLNPYITQFEAVVRETEPGQFTLFVIHKDVERPAPDYNYIILPTFKVDGQRLHIRKIMNGVARGIEWTITPISSPPPEPPTQETNT